LIVLTVVIHVCGLALKVYRRSQRVPGSSRFMPKFAVVIGGTALLASLLHGN
jgi:hypothetical protein